MTKFLSIILGILALVSVSADGVLLVVEDSIHDKLTNLPAFKARLATDGWTVEVLRYDSRIYNTAGNAFGVDVSSRAAIRLATNEIWTRVNAGLKHMVFIGELPVPVSGTDVLPDGHGNSYVVGDGWRDSVNTKGAYKAMQIYGAPGSIGVNYTDLQAAQLSLNIQRQNGVGDGRLDQNNFPGVKIKAAVGWIGGFGDVGIDPSGLIRRAGIIDAYLARNIAYRSGGWSLNGASYEFSSNSLDPHANANWLSQANLIYGASNVTVNAVSVLGFGALVTNRPVGFVLTYNGSSWLPNLIVKLARPFAAIEFLRLSYQFELPSGNYLGQAIKNSPNSGPIVCIPYYGSGQGLDIRLLGQGRTIGEMIIAASLAMAVTPVSVGCMGDVTLRLPGSNVPIAPEMTVTFAWNPVTNFVDGVVFTASPTYSIFASTNSLLENPFQIATGLTTTSFTFSVTNESTLYYFGTTSLDGITSVPSDTVSVSGSPP